MQATLLHAGMVLAQYTLAALVSESARGRGARPTASRALHVGHRGQGAHPLGSDPDHHPALSLDLLFRRRGALRVLLRGRLNGRGVAIRRDAGDGTAQFQGAVGVGRIAARDRYPRIAHWFTTLLA
jgi:hypothetical protein